jgi:hypothetical protein
MRAASVFACFLLAATAGLAEPLAREDVPEPLQPWIDWALRGHEAGTCPFLNESGERRCVWPGRLSLALDARGGSFTQEVFVAIATEVELPGGADGAWPEDVRVGGATASVVPLGARPAVRLPRGAHRVTGRFAWSALPPGLSVPPATGIVEIELDGERIARPRRDPDGMLWLRDGAAGATGPVAANRVDVEVHRRLDDDVPPRLETAVSLRVSGEAREERLGVALPAGFVPTALDSPLPARLDPDGHLRVQVRPGEWQLRIGARQAVRGDEFTAPAQAQAAAWDAGEIWSVALAPQLRLADLEGAPTIDPTQTEMPPEWRALPAFRMEPGAALRVVEKRRGNQGSAADQLALRRTWHLDFDARGATVVDQVSGTLRSSLRLEMGEATALGRAAIGGQDQPITKRAGSQRLGVETALGALALEADSRVTGGARRLSAVGWAHDFDEVAATLMVPPGYRLLHVTGVDDARSTWISRWDLLAIFFVLLIGVATGRLLGRQHALLALATLALVWPEPDAPKLVWLALVVAEALRRVARRGRAARAVQLLHLAVLVALVLIAVPFAISHLRVGLFPALERPYYFAPTEPPAAPADTGYVEFSSQDAVAQMEMAAPEPPPGPGQVKRSAELRLQRALERKGDLMAGAVSPGKAWYAPDPSATVPTGPGRPDWSWEAVALTWSGPVTQDQQVGLWLLPPWANALLAVARVLLLAALAAAFVRAWRSGRGAGGDGAGAPGRAPAAAHTLAGVLAAVAVFGAAGSRAADLPTPELLGELRDRLLAPADCEPRCATVSRLALAVQPGRLDLRVDVDAAAETGVPLPGGGADDGAWLPTDVIVDGAPAVGLFRDAAGVLWLRLAKGRHDLQLGGPLPPRATVELPLPIAPRRVSLAAPPAGWSVVGIREDGGAAGALQLVRESRAAEAAGAGTRLEPTPIPAFVRVTRALELGLSWAVTTTVERVAPADGPIVVEVPLLAGESVTTPGVRVEGARALVTIGAGEAAAAYASTLAIASEIALAAPAELPWTEVWQIAAGPLWHVETSGIPPVDELVEGSRARAFRPWPGETLALAIERPEGHGGATLTLDRSHLVLAPGLRATDAELTLALRSSQGGQHDVTLPEGAQLTKLAVNGEPQPLRQEGRRVPLALTPGAREISLGWREPRGVSALLRGSPVDLGADSVNAHVEIDVPDKRWVLFAGGPRLGPSVMFWSALAIVAGLAWLLGRLSWTPLRARHWLLLGIGMTQAPFAASVPVVACLLLLGFRGRAAERVRALRPLAFGALQVALLLVTLVAAGALVFAIQQGLLGVPEMRIAGNGSSSHALRWYLDRSAPLLPQPWVVSLSIWWYRAAMLAWSMWLALALVGWARWGFAQWSAGGAFRAERG